MTDRQFCHVMAMLWLIIVYVSESIFGILFAGFMVVYWVAFRGGRP